MLSTAHHRNQWTFRLINLMHWGVETFSWKSGRKAVSQCFPTANLLTLRNRQTRSQLRIMSYFTEHSKKNGASQDRTQNRLCKQQKHVRSSVWNANFELTKQFVQSISRKFFFCCAAFPFCKLSWVQFSVHCLWKLRKKASFQFISASQSTAHLSALCLLTWKTRR